MARAEPERAILGSPYPSSTGRLRPRNLRRSDPKRHKQPFLLAYVTVRAGPRYNRTADFHKGVRGFCVPLAA